MQRRCFVAWLAHTKDRAAADSHPKVKGLFVLVRKEREEKMTNGAARGTRQPMFLCKRGMQAHKSEIMERRQERSVGVRWRCLGAAVRPRCCLETSQSPECIVGTPGGPARGWPLRPDASGRLLFFCLASTQHSQRERHLSVLCVSVCVCALCYINLIVTRWETLVRKKPARDAYRPAY